MDGCGEERVRQGAESQPLNEREAKVWEAGWKIKR